MKKLIIILILFSTNLFSNNFRIEDNNYGWLWYAVYALIGLVIFVLYLNNRILRKKNIKEEELLEKYKIIEENTNSYSFTFIPSTKEFIDADSLKKVFELENDKNVTFEKLLSFMDLENQNIIHKVIQTAEKQKYTYKIKTQHGNIKYLQDICIPIKDENDDVKFFVSGVDITDKILLELEDKKKTQQLKELNDNLEKKVNDQTKILLSQNKILQDKNDEMIESEEKLRIQQEELINIHKEIENLANAKQQFLANMSHEIRTPLNGIIGIVDILLNHPNTDEFIIDKLNVLKKSSNILTSIVNDILDFSSLQSGKVKLYPKMFSLRDMIEHIEKTFKKEFVDQTDVKFKVNIEEDVEDTIIADELRLSQILLNLLSNSKKFTKKGYVSLNVDCTKKDDEKILLRFVVNDTGIGMSKNVKDNLFKAFTQGDYSNTKEYKGTGLGLVIVKNLIDMMDGKVNVSSIENSGTTFRIYLEFPYADHKVKASLKEQFLVLNEPKKALLVEDDKTNQIVLKAALEKRNFQIDIVNNGLEGVNSVKENQYDIVFMDIQMPVMDGHEATKEIRKFNKDILIVAISAGVLPENIDDSIKAGMNMHIMKPLNNDQLNEVIDKFFLSKELEMNQQKVVEETPAINNLDNVFAQAIEKMKKEYNDEVCRLILNEFSEQYKNHEESILELQNKDFFSYIHKLKGSSGNIGFTNIYDLCVKIEEIKNKDESVNEINELIACLNNFYENAPS